MAITEVVASTQAELTAKLADLIANEITDAISKRGVATLVLSGGNTPKPLLTTLAQKPLAWDKVVVTLADERWVDIDSDASNELMIRNTLLQGAASVASFIPLKNAASTAGEGQRLCQENLAGMPFPLDIVILGMGDDGHTASLFPGVSGSALYQNTEFLCQSIIPPVAPYERMTLTASALLNSRKIILHIVGDHKWKVYQGAREDGDIDDLPIRFVLHQNQVPVDVYWSP
jgi:6-phosphogluconolactonase